MQLIADAFQHPDLNDRPSSQIVKEVLGIGNNGELASPIPISASYSLTNH